MWSSINSCKVWVMRNISMLAGVIGMLSAYGGTPQIRSSEYNKDRLKGTSDNDFEQLEKARLKRERKAQARIDKLALTNAKGHFK